MENEQMPFAEPMLNRKTGIFLTIQRITEGI